MPQPVYLPALVPVIRIVPSFHQGYFYAGKCRDNTSFVDNWKLPIFSRTTNYELHTVEWP